MFLLDRSEARPATPPTSDSSAPGAAKSSIATITGSTDHASKYVAHETFPTLSDTVRRQWDPSKGDMDYEHLLQLRRKERLLNVDRYVPQNPMRRKTYLQRSTFPPERLPEAIKTRIFEILLVSRKPISIDLTWLRSFVKGHARIPATTRNGEVGGSIYSFPKTWNILLADIDNMQKDMAQFKTALETRHAKTRSARSPARGLSVALLLVSRTIDATAARIFYSQNVFSFPSATSAWMQLESFLATVGPGNVAEIQHIRIHAPVWHRGIQEDFVEGAIIDLLSPASRMAVIKPPTRDRRLRDTEYLKHANERAKPSITDP